MPCSPLFSATLATAPSPSQDGDVLFKPSFYKTQELDRRGRPIWGERKILSDVKVGDRLEGYIVQEHLEGKTGPKVYLECGLGRYNPKTGAWKLANAMLRLGNQNAKASVTQKRVARLRKKTSIECFVSRVRLGNGQLEVVLKEEDVPRDIPPKVSVASLKEGQELVGTVQRLVPYGAFVDVGANRIGLLHIQKVADLYGNYIDKERGLKEAGLERKAKIKVQIASNEKKRLFLDFTADVKEEAEKERIERQKKKEERIRAYEERRAKFEAAGTGTGTGSAAVADAVASVGTATEDTSTTTSSSSSETYEEEDDPYAAYAAEYKDMETSNDDDDDDEDDYDSYDEERDIEDSLGLGTY